LNVEGQAQAIASRLHPLVRASVLLCFREHLTIPAGQKSRHFLCHCAGLEFPAFTAHSFARQFPSRISNHMIPSRLPAEATCLGDVNGDAVAVNEKD